MNKNRIRYTDTAIDDLDLIFNYISKDNRDQAIKQLNKIENSILKLAEMPRLGVLLQTNDLSLVQNGYRYLVVAPYIVFYRVKEQEILIGRVLHSRQDWVHLLFEIN